MKKNIKILIVTTILSAIIGILSVNGKAFADTSGIIKKWTFMNLYNCIEKGQINSPLYNNGSGLVGDDVMSGGMTMYNLTGVTSYNTVNCREVLMGKGSDEGGNKKGLSGALDYVSGVKRDTRWNDENYSNVRNFLTRVGYDMPATNQSDSVSFRISGYAQSDGREMGSQTIVATRDDNQWSYKTTGTKTDSCAPKVCIKNKYELRLYKPSKLTCNDVGDNDSLLAISLDRSSVSSAYNSISQYNGQTLILSCRNGNNVTDESFIVNVATTDNLSAADIISNGPYSYTNSSVTLRNLGGYNSPEQLRLTDDEKYELYKGYIDQAIPELSTGITCDKKANETWKDEVYLKTSSGEWKIYYYDRQNANTSMNFLVQTDNLDSELVGFDDIIARLKELGAGATPFENGEECVDPESGVSSQTGKTEVGGETVSGDPSERCYENADVLGHTLCPILSAVSQFTDSIYYYIENNFLIVNNDLTGDSVRTAWGLVRDIANVCFVIVLLLIIFSQVTGIGIDNYGIKRLLPRLIVMAVLVNVSFLLCQVLVDVSNIVGVGIKNFLEGTIPLEASAIGNSGGAAGILGTIAGGGILVGLAVLNPGIILSLVAGIIGVVIGLLFLFVILIARQVAIVVLIILSPIALICYMLPNTEKYFTSWRKAFTALLIVYPICALAMGGGTMVANVLANAGDVEGNAVLLIGAMITNVIPFFFIPTLLQNSLAGLGSIGSKISGLGQRIGRGVGNFAAEGVKRTRTFNNLSMTSKGLQDEYLRKGEKNMLEKRAARLSSIPKDNRTKGQQRRLALAQSRLNAMNAEDATAEAGIKAKDYNTLLADANMRRFQEDVAGIKSQATMNGAINNLSGNDNYADSGDDFNFKEGTLEALAYQAGVNGNDEEMYAYMELLSSKGHAGQEGATQVISKLQAQGHNKAAQTMARAIMNNPNISGQYKSGARSQYNGLKNLAAATTPEELAKVANIRSKSNIHAGDYSKQSLANADKEELARIAAAMSDPNFKDADKFRSMAGGALQDSMIEGGTKLKNEEIMRQIAGVPVGEGSVQVHQPADTGNRPTENGRFTRLTNDQLLEVATRPGVDAGTADRAMAEVERRQKDGTMKV